LPAPLSAAVLVACGALALTKGALVAPPLFALAVVLTYLFPARLSTTPARWLVRLALWGLAALAAFLAPNNGLDEFIDWRWSNLLGYLCAAEIVVQAWSRRPGMTWLFILPCGVLLAASITYQSRWIQVLTPVFILCLALSFPHCHSRTAPRSRGVRIVTALLFLAILALGLGLNTAVLRYQVALNEWGARLITMYPLVRLGVSQAPVLGHGPGTFSSPEPVMRLNGGYRSIYYMRGIAFDTYRRGHWLPTLLDRPLKMVPFNTPDVAGYQIHIIKYAQLENLLFTPLETANVVADSDIVWSPEYGGPLESSSNNVMSYRIFLAPQGSTGIWTAPTPAQRERMLRVPPEVDPGVRQLADEIGRHALYDIDKIRQVKYYLLTNYQYSTTIYPGFGDPVSNFLLKKKSAHCEYFASSATILLRCMGIPARYVVGYYAHEHEFDGGIVIRQRDAHAWAEAWVDDVGWITVETTPSNGRPDSRMRNPLSWWQQAKNRVHYELYSAGAWFGRLRLRHLAAVILAILATYLLLLLLRLFRRRAEGRRTILHALPPDRRQAELVTRFTAWLARIGAPCPPGLPWQEHLARLETEPPDKARAFVLAYNSVRFGSGRNEDKLAELSALLASLEKEKS